MSPNPTLYELAQAIEGASTLGNGQLAPQALVTPHHPPQTKPCLLYAPSLQALATLNPNQAGAAVLQVNQLGELANLPEAWQEALTAKRWGLLLVPRLRFALAHLTHVYNQPTFIEQGIDETAVVHPTAQIAPTATLGPYVVVGAHTTIADHCTLHAHVSVGAYAELDDHCTLHAGVRLGDRVRLGKRVIVQPNAVIGSDGFSYVTAQPSRHEDDAPAAEVCHEVQAQHRINSLGTVVLEDDVEVGANTCIDRGTLAETRIAQGTKIDNLTQIGHNNRVGKHCLIVSQVGLSGSCVVGDGVVLAGQTGVADHLKIGEGAIAMAKSGVMRDIEPNSIVGGIPAMPRKQVLENLIYTSRLKSMAQELKELKKQVAALSKAVSVQV
jgi:UDP-3-O-[3-hydroxymyristoyl] glucosamine N-acyltransferase